MNTRETHQYRNGHGAFLACIALTALSAWLGVAGAAADPAIWGGPGSGSGQFDTPWDVALAPDGDVYVADRGNYRIQHFSATGDYLGQWGALGSEPGKFGDDLVAVAVAPNGKVFALDQRLGDSGFRVQRFDGDGAYETGWGGEEGAGLGQFDHPTDIAVGPGGRVYILEAGNHRVQTFDADGSDAAAWGTAGNGGEGEFAAPAAIAIDASNGDVYVADGGSTPQVQAFSAGGDFITQWGSAGSGNGQFPSHGLVGVAVGVDGDVYTRESQPSNEGGNRFQRFTPAGGFVALQYWTDSIDPRGLAVNEDSLYAPDASRNRIQVFDLRQPAVSLLAPYLSVGIGQTVFFQSTATVPLGRIVDYEWDLDGDGIYEIDTGTTPETQHVYRQTGRLTARLRVTSDLGGTAVDQREVTVVVPPPPGPVGVSINDGHRFTRDPNVTITVRWPQWTNSLQISNDGGFVPSDSVPVMARIPWRLDPRGPERQPKTIYVRFENDSQTYQDDIVLDRRQPVVRVFFIPHHDRSARLNLAAKDNASGVSSVQLMRKGKPGAWRPFTKSVVLRGPATGLSVRVRDRAGNDSAWEKVRRPAIGA